MSESVLVAALVCSLVVPTVASGPTATATVDGPTLVGVHPNPAAAGDRGEYVLLSVPPGTDLGRLAIADDEATVPLPNRTAGGRIAVSPDPETARNLTDRSVVAAPGLGLANGGERLRLLRDGRVVDTLVYESAPEGEYRINGTWRPVGVTDRPVVETGPGRVRTFLLPDSPRIPVETLRTADERVLLAGYSLTSERVVRELRRASERGVRVRVLVDGSPVGGLPRRQARRLDALATVADVRVLDGPRAPYAFHHAKYAVVDDRAVVLTENWKPAGTGGASSRGWGVTIRDAETAEALAATFRTDAAGRGVEPWDPGTSRETVETEPATGGYRERFRPREVPVESVRVLVAPDNAEGELTALLSGADESIRVQQVSLGDRENSLTQATLAAARRGVRVRILLSGAWYVREENRRRVRWLNRLADREGLDLEAKLARPRGRFEKVHAKGIVVDGEQVVVGSVNWNRHSLRENREVAVVLEGEAVGDYYRRAFRADWRGGRWRLSLGVVVAVVLAALAAIEVGRRRIGFSPR